MENEPGMSEKMKRWAQEQERVDQMMGPMDNQVRLADPATWAQMFMLVLACAAMVMYGLHCNAITTCAPKAGKWTPWTGTVCYGEKP